VNQVAVAVLPASVNLLAGATCQFAARVSGTSNPAVAWSVVSGAGTIDGSGLFTAPAAAGPCQIQATPLVEPDLAGLATINVDLVGIAITPASATLDQGASKPFAATLSGATVKPGLLWQVAGTAGGSVDANGNYTAGTSAGIDYVNVYSQEDPTRVATATVTVNPPAGFTLSLPSGLAVVPGGSASGQIVVNPAYGFTGTVTFAIPGITGTPFANDCKPTASASGTTLYVTAPPAQAAGTYDQVVTATCGSLTVTGTVAITVNPEAPVITSLSPAAGVPEGGTGVTITGTGLGTITKVSFGGMESSQSAVISPTEVITSSVSFPAGQQLPIVVTNAAGVASTINNASLFTFMNLPVLTSIAPQSGSAAGGAAVSLAGADFIGATGVYFGTVPASSFVLNFAFPDTLMTVIAPPIPGGLASVPVTVVNAAGPSLVTANDVYTLVYATPVVAFALPDSGPLAGGTHVTLYGSGFMGATGVAFGTTPAAGFTVVYDTEISALVPAEAAGTVDITVTNPSATSATVPDDQFTFAG
jgi:hypothetical protein